MAATPEAQTAQPRSAVDDSRPARARVHFPGLEGIRALAASMVVVHHAVSFSGDGRAGPLAKYGAVGDMGVGLFFVLSGFLIYRPFAVAGLDGTTAQRAVAFWWRRLLRIVPAFWLVLTVWWVAGSYDLGSPSEIIRYYLFLQIYDSATALGGITIAWSLNTEISFYLMVPIWAWLLRRVIGRGRTTLTLEAAALLALGAGGYVARYLFTRVEGPNRGLSFLWLPTNLDLFAAGMLMAVLHAWITGTGRDTVWAERIHKVLGGSPILWAAGFVALYTAYAYQVGVVDFVTGYQGLFWQRRQLVITLLAAFLIAPMVFRRPDADADAVADAAGGRNRDRVRDDDAVVAENGEREVAAVASGRGAPTREPVRWFWEWAPVRWVGMVSYGLYLWHFPFIERMIDKVDPYTGEVVWDGWARLLGEDTAPKGDTPLLYLLAAGFGLGLLAAGLSWYLLEKPLQRFKRLVR